MRELDQKDLELLDKIHSLYEDDIIDFCPAESQKLYHAIVTAWFKSENLFKLATTKNINSRILSEYAKIFKYYVLEKKYIEFIQYLIYDITENKNVFYNYIGIGLITNNISDEDNYFLNRTKIPIIMNKWVIIYKNFYKKLKIEHLKTL